MKKYSDLGEIWVQTYFTKPLLLVCIIIALVGGIKFYRKENIYLYFLFYQFISLITLTFLDFLVIKTNHSHLFFIRRLETSNNILGLLEFAIFYDYFFKILKSQKTQVFMRVSIIPFVLLVSLFFLKLTDPLYDKYQITNLSFKINVLEFFLLLIPSLVYYYESFKFEKSGVLTTLPSFWIITGLFIYCAVSLPFLLIGDELAFHNRKLYNLMFGIHFISMSFLSICLFKAFQCKKSLIS